MWSESPSSPLGSNFSSSIAKLDDMSIALHISMYARGRVSTKMRQARWILTLGRGLFPSAFMARKHSSSLTIASMPSLSEIISSSALAFSKAFKYAT